MLKPRKKTTVSLVSVEADPDEAWKRPDAAKIFFIESSGRDHLLPRQACAIESALRNSGIDTLVVVMTSKGISAKPTMTQPYVHMYGQKGLNKGI
jgi:hypothetical protein